MLRSVENQGKLSGLRIDEGKTLLHQLFADDTWIFLEDKQENFIKLKRILARYELALAPRPKSQGGLGFLTFAERSRALQMRYTTAIMEDKSVEWVWICKRWIRFKLISGPHQREQRVWECQEAMLLLPALRIPEAPTVNRILQGWFSMRKKLSLDEDTRSLPGSLTFGALKVIWQLQGKQQDVNWIKIEGEARKQKLLQLKDLVCEGQQLSFCRLKSSWEDNSNQDILWDWLEQLQITDKPLHRIEGWRWADNSEVGPKWHKENRRWSRLIWSESRGCAAFQRKWVLEETEIQWRHR
ncbi:hypothetical protein R1sor_008708 [Riccia sorocarpa]|uniref:Reverse transcriptase domain-containing protein n=1 Tax=Riccia sorocarpa TaxID=122646 RepID=A0ABD3HU68_9MARC